MGLLYPYDLGKFRSASAILSKSVLLELINHEPLQLTTPDMMNNLNEGVINDLLLYCKFIWKEIFYHCLLILLERHLLLRIVNQ